MATRIALITGTSRGLGRSIALHLARRDTEIIGTYREGREGADAVAAEIVALGARSAMLPLDINDSAGFHAFAATVQDTLRRQFDAEQFDVLVNNAGIGVYAPFRSTTEAQFDELVRVHLKGPFFLTQALLPLIADEGRILNVSTGLARFTLPGYAAYAAAKGGVEVLTRYMAQELGDRRIRVNVLAPGAIATDFAGGAVRDNPALNEQVASMIPLGRVGEPDDIGAAAAAIVSDDLGWANGTRIEVSGGQHL